MGKSAAGKATSLSAGGAASEGAGSGGAAYPTHRPLEGLLWRLARNGRGCLRLRRHSAQLLLLIISEDLDIVSGLV